MKSTKSKEKETQNLKGERNISINGSNEKISDFFENLVLTIKSINLKLKNNIKKILIIGDKIEEIYKSLYKLFPNLQYVVSNKSEVVLNQIMRIVDSSTYIQPKVIDIFDGSTLTDFYLDCGKFNLIILSGLFRNNNIQDNTIKNSIIFLYKHFLTYNGILVILDFRKNLSQDFINLLKRVKYFKKVINSSQKKGVPLQYLIFNKRSRLKIFGD